MNSFFEENIDDVNELKGYRRNILSKTKIMLK